MFLQLHHSIDGALLKRTCLSCSSNNAVLSNLKVGHYTIGVDYSNENEVQFSEFDVVDLFSHLPVILLSSSSIEAVASPPRYVSDIQLRYRLDEIASGSVEQLEACVRVLKADGTVLVSRTCLERGHDLISLSSIAEGDYMLHLGLRVAATGTFIDSSEIKVPIGIHRLSDFIPTYEWKVVHEWESVPSGLEIR